MQANAGRPDGDQEAQPLLSVRDLQAYYRTSHSGVRRGIRAVDGVSFKVRRGEIYGLAGESSSGKTTLIKSIAGAIRPPLEIVGGSIEFAFLPGYGGLHRAPREDVERIRWQHLSYIMQGSMSVLNPVRRIKSSFVDFAYPHIGGNRTQFEQQVVDHLAWVKLDPSVLAAFPHELSGGMRQRVALALATICRPGFVIADEPTTALDVVVQKEVLGMIRGIQRETGSSVLFVTHDMGVHAHITDRLAIMYAGRLVEEAATAEIFRNPQHPYTKHLISSLPRIGDDAPRQGLGGTPPNLADPPSGCRFHPRCPLASEICSREVPVMLEAAAGHRVACFAVIKDNKA
ncbi:ABC transporter ATP-binding protein [Bradyrhizobium sp. WYCCWR 13022]|uniref:ABC transporter ATP-binding protein n=1 Tax=unclassified Bradyrhizobium TaxID=2631580 RepID=UPI00263A836D|nr:ABC transporter ATP-binding protein [Bradyrhizobium sp. WYCCWR 13022]MDN4984039.1 ABC transporter ATP-binding protein [Bradyrhizobium sp. WYCCWR 13022]